jgi:hypothetical protein
MSTKGLLLYGYISIKKIISIFKLDSKPAFFGRILYEEVKLLQSFTELGPHVPLCNHKYLQELYIN